MGYVRGLVCVGAMLLATAAFAESNEGASDEESGKVESLLSSKLIEKIKSYLDQGVMESEQLGKYVDRDYWNAIKDEFSTHVSTAIDEDEFIQAVLPIIDSVRAELLELIQLTLQEVLKRGDGLSTKVWEALAKLKHRVVEIIEAAITKIQATAESMPDEYEALITKVGEAVGEKAVSVIQKTTLVAAIVLSPESTGLLSFWPHVW